MTTTTRHRHHSSGNIPFSWENSPGISKVAPRFDDSPTPDPCTYVDVDVVDRHRKLSMIAKPIVEKLPPPPPPPPTKYFSGGRGNLLMPLPPCMFHAPAPPPQQPHRRSAASKGHRPARKEADDPFLAAYKECTKSFNKEKVKKSKKGSTGWLGLGFSCKQGSGVRDDRMVTVSAAARNSGVLLQIRDGSLERSRSTGVTGMAAGGHQRRKSISI